MIRPALEKSQYALQENEKQWFVSEIPVLRATISIPQCTSKNKLNTFEKRLNRYYQQCSHSFLSYCNRYLYPKAAAEFENCANSGLPFICSEAAYTSTISCNKNEILSVYSDCTEYFSAVKELIVRYSDTWDLTKGQPISAKECFPQNIKFKKICIEAALKHCQMQASAGLCVYLDHLPMRLKRYFNPRNFYLSDTGFHFFYQPYSIAPMSEGFPTFCLPFSDETGPALPITISS